MVAEVEYDEQVLRDLAERGRAVARRAIELTALDVWGKIKEEAPVDHGRLAGSFQLEPIDDLTWRIASGVHYALYVHEGTGIHGPSGSPIVPQNASVLRFEVGGRPVFARSVEGQEPNPYADRAIGRAEQRTDEYVQMAFEEVGE